MKEDYKTAEVKIEFIIKIGFPGRDFYELKTQLNKSISETKHFNGFREFLEEVFLPKVKKLRRWLK
jgi:hypothetical protein